MTAQPKRRSVADTADAPFTERPTGDRASGSPRVSGNRPTDVQEWRRVLEGCLGVPATEGNDLQPLVNGKRIFPAMLDAIERADVSVDLLTFIYWRGDVGQRFAQALTSAAHRGVRVRVLLDAWGSHPIDKSVVSSMQEAGVQLRWFRPFHRMRPGKLNHRTHRKVMIVDERIGFTGGVGIADVWDGDARNPDEWRDTHFRVQGPAVDGLRAAFLDNWLETDDVLIDPEHDRFPLQPHAGDLVVQCVRGASEVGQSDVATLLRVALCSAVERVRITTAYFAPDTDLLRLLAQTAARGVQVEVLLPGPHIDKRFVQLSSELVYQELLDTGVTIYNFQPSMLHAKVMTVDRLVAVIGSANLNTRSVEHDEEVNLVVLSPDFTAQLDQQFEADVERSRRIQQGRWRRRSVTQRVLEHSVRPIRRLF